MSALEISKLTKIYKNGVVALKGIDLQVAAGDFFALLGPNGAGKSTTIGILASLVNKTSGTVKIFGHDIDEDWAQAKSCIGLVPQEFNFGVFEAVQEIVVSQAGYYGVPRAVALRRAEHYLKKLGLWEKRLQIARNLSGGMKRRLMIARALIHEPKMLILDEPTAGVDIELRRSMWHFLRELNQQGTTIILTTHYLEEAENLCRGIAIIDKGNIIKHTTVKQLLTELHTESFILDLEYPLEAPPVIAPYEIVQLDPTTLEVVFAKQDTLNALFTELTRLGIQIKSLRNKTNRLEELFLQLITG